MLIVGALAAAALAADPFPVVTDTGEVSITAYALPAPDPAWITDDALTRSCVVAAVHTPDQPLAAEVVACEDPMVPAFVEATQGWSADGPAGRFEIAYVVKYSPVVQAMTVSAQVDPGLAVARQGVRGPPGVKLVHPAVVASLPDAKLPGKAKKAGIPGAVCQLHLWVDDLGRVAQYQVETCPEELVKAVEKVGRKARLTARYVDGNPVPAELLVDVEVGEPPAGGT